MQKFNDIILQEFDQGIEKLDQEFEQWEPDTHQKKCIKYEEIIKRLKYIQRNWYLFDEIYICQKRSEIIQEIFTLLKQDDLLDYNHVNNQKHIDHFSVKSGGRNRFSLDSAGVEMFKLFYEWAQDLYTKLNDDKKTLGRIPSDLQSPADVEILTQLTKDLAQFESKQKIYTKAYLTPQKIAALKRSELMLWTYSFSPLYQKYSILESKLNIQQKNN
jgi:hypothetical protein